MVKKEDLSVYGDLAEERHEARFCEGGVRFTKRSEDGITVSELSILTQEGAETIGRGIGRYITVSHPSVHMLQAAKLHAVSNEMVGALKTLLPHTPRKLLVAGLGSHDLTADSLGVKAISRMRSERGEAEWLLTSALGTEAETGIESAAHLRALVRECKPDAVLVIDALATADETRLLRAIELCDTGISPGSGIGERKSAINADTMGAPTVAIGVPTVMRVSSLLRRYSISKDRHPSSPLFVTPALLDLGVLSAAHLIADTIHAYFKEVIK